MTGLRMCIFPKCISRVLEIGINMSDEEKKKKEKGFYSESETHFHNIISMQNDALEKIPSPQEQFVSRNK
jgi:hypothetical protein